MSSWMNEAAVQNHNGNGFPHIDDHNAVAAGAMIDTSTFMAAQAGFHPAAAAAAAAGFANPQQMMGMPNGPMRNASPSYSIPVYQTSSFIPSKRPRPRDDTLASSPRQNQNILPPT